MQYSLERREQQRNTWEKVVEDTDRFYRKYQTEFSKELALALANELERKAKHEAEQTTVQERMGIHFGRCRGTSWGE
mgnify:CR=1 FL=1